LPERKNEEKPKTYAEVIKKGRRKNVKPLKKKLSISKNTSSRRPTTKEDPPSFKPQRNPQE
jgi:hypothetical protein